MNDDASEILWSTVMRTFARVKTFSFFNTQLFFFSAEESTAAGNNPPTFFVQGCVGAANVCNGFYKINKELVNEKPQYNGPKLENDEKTTLWFSEKLNQWIFTKSSEVNSEDEINIFAYVDSQANQPLEIEAGVIPKIILSLLM